MWVDGSKMKVKQHMKLIELENLSLDSITCQKVFFTLEALTVQ